MNDGTAPPGGELWGSRSGSRRKRLASFRRNVIVALAAWSAIMASSLAWNVHIQVEQTYDLARREAHANFDKDKAFRLWAASHGGVYVPVDERTLPNPALADVPERDVVTPSGTLLTLMNPAYMVRQMMEDFGTLYGVRGRITSLTPINPANAPDPWEEKALHAFERGAQEIFEVADIEGRPHYRLMRPMITEKACLKCHAAQGYREGDIRGGVGVAVDMGRHRALARDNIRMISASHAAIWLCGTVAIGAAARLRRRRLDEELADEAALHELSRRNEIILATMAEGIYGVGRDGVLTFINPAGARLLGYPAEELLGRFVHDVIHCSHADGSANRGECPVLRTLREGKEVESADEVFRARDGTEFPVVLLSAPIIGNGGVEGAVVVFRDITDARRKERELREHAERLQASNAELEQFAYAASHDLREPLRMVTSYVTLLERRFADRLDDDGREFIAFARDGAMRMDRLIVSLLEYSRVGRDSQPMAPHPLAGIVATALANLDASIRELGAVVDVAPDLPEVEVHADEMVRLFQNLIGNALKFHAPDRVPHVAVTCVRQGDYWRIGIGDNGIGIDPEYFDRIFQIFQRLHAREAYDGAGIGLAICKKIVQRHGGRIWVESAAGQGSTFHFTLPARK